jgi:tetratricopeptide (TPR) repeat protein
MIKRAVLSPAEISLVVAACLLLPAVPVGAAPATRTNPATTLNPAIRASSPPPMRTSADFARDISGLVFYKNRDIDNALIRTWHLLAKNDFAGAMALSNQILEIMPRCAQALLLKGYCLFKCEQSPQAVICIKRALSLLPAGGLGVRITPECGPDWTFFVLSAAQMEAGQEQDALATLDKGLLLYKTSGVLYLKRAGLDRNFKRYDAAVADASAAIKIGNLEAYTERAKAYMALNKNDLAIADLTRGMSFMPNEIELYALRAQAYKLCGKPDLAKKDRDTAYRMGQDTY